MCNINRGGMVFILLDLELFLKENAATFGVMLDDANVCDLAAFKEFLLEYNKNVNLTAITEDREFAVKHFLDSLTILPYIEKKSPRVIDVGTGAGFPGVVAKIARPDLEITLLDARAKKVKFLQQVVELLKLTNVDCIHGRAEEIVKTAGFAAGFDYATSRAVGPIKNLAAWCLPFIKPGGLFIAMKGPNFADELDEARPLIKKNKCKIVDIKNITLVDEIERNLILIEKI